MSFGSYFLVYNLIGLAVVSIIYLIYCLNPNKKKGNVISEFFLHQLPNSIMAVGNKIFGDKFEKNFYSLMNYIFKTNNSLIMIFYLLISPGCYLLFVALIMVPYF